jgi:hypothetical protein
MANRKRARHRTEEKTNAASASLDQTRTTPKLIDVPAIPLAAVLSFLKDTRGVLTWSTQDMVNSLKIDQWEAKQIIDILSLQGYVKPALDNRGWLTTPAGEDVSGSKLPRYKLDSVNEALAILEKTIKSVNQDRNAKYHISDAVAYGDFLLGRSMVQAADVGVRLVPSNGMPEESASSRQTVDFLKQLRHKSALIQLRPYEPWMSIRSHRKLV